MTDTSTMPAAFIGHGSPMNTPEHNRDTDAWRAFGDSVPTPRAVLAHMYPGAPVPVLELSIIALQPLEYDVDLGARLAPLREQGVLVVGSGPAYGSLSMTSYTLGTS